MHRFFVQHEVSGNGCCPGFQKGSVESHRKKNTSARLMKRKILKVERRKQRFKLERERDRKKEKWIEKLFKIDLFIYLFPKC